MATINKILVVDDSDIERQHVVKILKEAGFTVVEAVSGEDGVQKAIEHRPDLIFMDVMMPGVNGFQATRHLSRSEDTKNIPVFMLTSRGEDTDRAWGMKQGASKYFTKPADKTAVLAEITKLQSK